MPLPVPFPVPLASTKLIDKLVSKVDTIRQRAADKFGLPTHNVYRVERTWSGGEIGVGTATDSLVLLTPTPKVVFSGSERLEPHGRVDDRKMVMTEVSLTYTENYLQGEPRAAGVELFYMLVERNFQESDPTTWVVSNIPTVQRGSIDWRLEFKPYRIC